MSLIEPKPDSAQYALNLADCLASRREASTKLTACRGFRRAFGLLLLSFEKLRDALLRLRWTVRDEIDGVRFKLARSRREWTANTLAHDLALLRPQSFLRWPEDTAVVVDALSHFADRRLRRARAVAWACLFAAVVAMGARDGNCNGRADVLDLAAAAREISGFGTGMPAEIARRTAAPSAVRRG